MYSKLYLAIFLCAIVNSLDAQDGYTSWMTGDAEDVETSPLAGIVLAGGGSDNDQAMQWMLERANGGDVVILRASGSDGYNDYFFSELGVTVNSVETIRFDEAVAANDPYVETQIRNAEVLFLAGGDQTDYFDYWKDTPIEDAINYLINEKGVTVGGTSAGMAILGGHYYVPTDLGIFSEEALADPFHPYMDQIGTSPFIEAPYLEKVITDTHYDQRDRPGRHMVFLATTASMTQERSFGIACNEVTAVAIDQSGMARVFGEYPAYDDFAYFLQMECGSDNVPELMEAGMPFTWENNNEAVIVYKAPGRTDGSTTFDLNDWIIGEGGEWEHWYVSDGVLSQVSTTSLPCNPLSDEEAISYQQLDIYPNPAEDFLQLPTELVGNWQLRNILGQSVSYWQGQGQTVDLSSIKAGWYQVELQAEDGLRWQGQFLKQ